MLSKPSVELNISGYMQYTFKFLNFVMLNIDTLKNKSNDEGTTGVFDNLSIL